LSNLLLQKERLEHRHMVSQDKITEVVGPTADYERQSKLNDSPHQL